MDKCAECGRHDDGSGTITVRLCSACKTVGYCSRDCQKRHWPNHKKECAKPDTEKAPTKKSSGLKTEAEGKTTTRPDDGNQGDGAKMTCHKCGLQQETMNRCSSCHSVTYCSRDCQRADWKTHRPVCSTVLDKTTTPAAKEDSPKKGAANPSDLQPKGANQRAQKTSVPSDSSFPRKAPGGTSSSPAISWDEARSRAAKKYPGHRIVDLFPEMLLEIMGMVVRGLVAVFKIGVVYPHYLHHGRCLEDAEGNPSFVIFYTPKDSRPYFRYNQLREGSFLCYENAHMHFFMDGTVGLRIDDPREVHILEPLKQKTTSTTSPGAAASPSPSPAPDPSPPSSSPSSTSGDSWRRARKKAAAMFPDVEVVDRFQDIDHRDLKEYMNLLSLKTYPDQPSTLYYKMLPPEKTSMIGEEVKVTLVVELVSHVSGPAFMRHWIVKDRQGTPAHMELEFSDQAWPNQRFADLRKGQFLCVSRPKLSIDNEEFLVYTISTNNPRRAAAFSF